MFVPITRILFLSAAALAVPAPAPAAQASPTPTSITNNAQLASAVAGIEANAKNGALLASAFLQIISQIVPPTAAASIPEALSRVASAYAAHPTDFLSQGAALILAGAAPQDFLQIAEAYTIFNNQNNVNLRQPASPVYPKKSASDAPYDLSEAELRSKIYFPPGFTYGRKPIVLFVPGTGGYAGEQFGPNYGKLLANIADTAYLNIPNNNLNDIQSNAEYVAYATNYISGISGNRKISLISWSQGSLIVRWAQKYWPSTRNATTFAHAISGDYHGTVLAEAVCPDFPNLGCAPSVLQQEYNSTFIATLRNNGGDSAYTALNSAYSAFDEVVQPQQGTGASAYSLDARGVGVTNIYLQDYCGSVLPGGTFYNTHEGVLYNALAYEAALNSIKSGKNADLSAINIASACEKFAADGLSLNDIFATEANIPIAGFNIVAAPNKQMTEPRIKDYARKDIPPGYSG